MPEPEPEEKDGDEIEGGDEPVTVEDDGIEQHIRIGEQDRWLLESLVPLLTSFSDGTQVEPRVQLAWDMMKIAVCERVCRIVRFDLPEDRA